MKKVAELIYLTASDYTNKADYIRGEVNKSQRSNRFTIKEESNEPHIPARFFRHDIQLSYRMLG
jgi:hypothetical protein